MTTDLMVKERVSIIDRDIAFYKGEIERFRSLLKAAPQGEEARFFALIRASNEACRSLQAYKSVLEIAA